MMISQGPPQQETRAQYWFVLLVPIVVSAVLFILVLSISIVGMNHLDRSDVCYNYQDENNFWRYVDGEKNLPADAWNPGKHDFKGAFGLFFYLSAAVYFFLMLHTLFESLHKYFQS